MRARVSTPTFLVLVAAVACGTDRTSGLDRRAADASLLDANGDAGAHDGEPHAVDAGHVFDAGMVQPVVHCAGITCGEGEVCAVFDDVGVCYPLGEEPSFENGLPDPWPTLLLYCDGDSDCAPGQRCVLNPGEIFRAECADEAAACPIHIGHLCTTDNDCHPCPNPPDHERRTVCRPSNVGVAAGLHACTWAD